MASHNVSDRSTCGEARGSLTAAAVNAQQPKPKGPTGKTKDATKHDMYI